MHGEDESDYRDQINQFESDWKQYRRGAPRREDQEAFDRLLVKSLLALDVRLYDLS